jgi:hypothetical protein
MSERNQFYENLFLAAANAYKDWLMCGKDFSQHSDRWDIWDDAIQAYILEAQINRIEGINQIRIYLGMEKLA